MKTTPLKIAQEEGETRPTAPPRLLRVGQTVKVQRGSLAGLRGTLLLMSARQRWLVQLQDAPPGVLLEIDSALLDACDGTAEEPVGDQEASPPLPLGCSTGGELVVL
jgi:hypothetical protein